MGSLASDAVFRDKTWLPSHLLAEAAQPRAHRHRLLPHPLQLLQLRLLHLLLPKVHQPLLPTTPAAAVWTLSLHN